MDSKTDLGSLKCIPYEPPQWLVGKLKYMPTHRIHLGNFPTPIQPWNFEGTSKHFFHICDSLFILLVEGKKRNLLIKRDDFSEMAASGNKIRKLEFIFAEVKEGGHDLVLSIGGTQSNHCRSVSAIAARLGIF
jgi:D-cysteine desulfhydrase